MQALSTAAPGNVYTIKWMFGLPEVLDIIRNCQIEEGSEIRVFEKFNGGLIIGNKQVGCPVGCIFCESGRNGFVRNLTSSEIVQQIILLRRKG